eukprot:9601849-Alexandrium_andersonii.AAC.1
MRAASMPDARSAAPHSLPIQRHTTRLNLHARCTVPPHPPIARCWLAPGTPCPSPRPPWPRTGTAGPPGGARARR